MFLASVTAFQIYINKGYRASYDDEAIYLRPDGINWRFQYGPERVMRFDEIEVMATYAGKIRIKPFELIYFNRAGWDGKEMFFLSRIFLRENELKTLLRFAYTKIPEKFPQDIIDYMNAEPGWIERKQIEAAD